MKRTLALLALATSVLASPYPQGVSDAIAPSSPPPEGCMTSHDGTFQITVVNVSSSATKRDLERVGGTTSQCYFFTDKQQRQLDGPLTLTLTNSDLFDQAGRTGVSRLQSLFLSYPGVFC